MARLQQPAQNRESPACRRGGFRRSLGADLRAQVETGAADVSSSAALAVSHAFMERQFRWTNSARCLTACGTKPTLRPFCASEVTSLPWLLPGPSQLQPPELGENSSLSIFEPLLLPSI